VAKPSKHGDKWRIRWLDEHGKRQSAVFDDYKVGQMELRRHQVEVEEIRRGVRNATPPDKTFGDLCDYWLEKRAPRKRSRKDDESIIRRHLRPAFGPMKVRDVGVEEVDGYINEKIDSDELSDKTVNNHVTLLATMLRVATTFKMPWLAMVPRFRKPKIALFSRDFQWLRSDEELLHDCTRRHWFRSGPEQRPGCRFASSRESGWRLPSAHSRAVEGRSLGETDECFDPREPSRAGRGVAREDRCCLRNRRLDGRGRSLGMRTSVIGAAFVGVMPNGAAVWEDPERKDGCDGRRHCNGHRQRVSRRRRLDRELREIGRADGHPQGRPGISPPESSRNATKRVQRTPRQAGRCDRELGE
jgi:Phage integrase, N-terminal SAM-like domain